MGTELRDTNKQNNGTTIKIVHARECGSIFGRKVCTPEIRLRAYLHLAPHVVTQLSRGTGAAAAAISTALTATGAGAPAAAITALVGALIVAGFEAFKHPDGSLDMSITQIAIRLGATNFPLPVDPVTTNILLAAL